MPRVANVLFADNTDREKVPAELDELFNNPVHALLAHGSVKANGKPRPFDRLYIVLDHKLREHAVDYHRISPMA